MKTFKTKGADGICDLTKKTSYLLIVLSYGIVASALHLFNTKGISQTSIQDMMNATSLPKGTIYRRFKNKEEIVLAAFEKGGEIIWNHIVKATEQHDKIMDKLLAISYIYQDAVDHPPKEVVHF